MVGLHDSLEIPLVLQYLDSIVAQYRFAIVKPADLVHRMAGHHALELCVLVDVDRLHLRL